MDPCAVAVVMPGPPGRSPRPTRDRTTDIEDRNMSESLPEVYLARHGETAWTITRQHTGRTDIPLTARGEDNAWGLHDRLRGLTFDRVFVSPLRRARQTCQLAGLRRAGREPSGPDGVGLRRVRGPDDGRDPRGAAGLVALPRRLPGRRVGRGGRRPGRPGHRPAPLDAGPHPALRPRPLLPRAGRALAGAAAGRRAASCSAPRRCRILGYEHAPEDPAIRLWNDDRHAVPAGRDDSGRRRSSVAIERSSISRRTPSHENASHHRRGTQGEDGRPAGPHFRSNAPRTVRMRAGRVLRDARCLLRPAPGLRPRRPPGAGRPARSASRPWPGRSATCCRSAG